MTYPVAVLALLALCVYLFYKVQSMDKTMRELVEHHNKLCETVAGNADIANNNVDRNAKRFSEIVDAISLVGVICRGLKEDIDDLQKVLPKED